MSHFHAAGNVRPFWSCDSEEYCADRADVALYLRRLFLPLWRNAETLTVATADLSPENLCWLAARYGAVRYVEAPRLVLLEEIHRRFEAELTDRAISSLARERPELSAQRVASAAQCAALIALVLIAVCAFHFRPFATLAAFVVAMTLLFGVATFFRVLLSWLGGLPSERKQEIANVSDATLPVYSILVPLYREAGIVPNLVRALRALEYPSDKLDIKIIVESDDNETVGACRELELLPGFEVVRVPPSFPRTKPKAVNYALRHARGDCLVIFDAEDRPERDQLLKAVSLFRSSPRTVAFLRSSFLLAARCYRLWSTPSCGRSSFCPACGRSRSSTVFPTARWNTFRPWVRWVRTVC